ncbi:hypothetical protein BKA66DRAFT_212072 [Pyrenochaeta sp. MPI-SDFR-AT-0127]|nr:hypothetical protein BKA66DRAFT_212072 [Pyrenochaeta sp. MPI-SDFR-AT-0127]
MAGLLSLPTEIICEIFENLKPTDEVNPYCDDDDLWDYRASYRTLAALTRTCRCLNPMATQALYKRYCARYTISHPGFMRRLCTDKTISEMVRDIKLLHNGPLCQHRGRSEDEIKAQILEIPVLDRPEVERLLNRDPSQVELAILVSQASNLESMSMEVYYLASEPHPQRVPLWLRPLVEAGRKLPLVNNPREKTMYGMLHSLTLRVHETCSYELAYLLCLPSLRRLQLDGLLYQARQGEDGQSFKSPIPIASSGVHTLKLHDIDAPSEVITWFISGCKALTEFKCQRENDSEAYACTQAWCANILSALEQHSASLTSLMLEPGDEFLKLRPDYRYARLEGFERLSSLKLLVVPWMLLMGRPPASSVINGTYKSYPRMRHLLPPNLEELSLSMSPWTAPGVSEEILLSSLPRKPYETDMKTSLQNFNIRYYSLIWGTSLPCNFWNVKHAYRRSGVAFSYTIFGASRYDVDDIVPSNWDFISMADELATHGPKAMEMAWHFGTIGEELVGKVAERLGLELSWLESEEGRRIMFLDDGEQDEAEGDETRNGDTEEDEKDS